MFLCTLTFTGADGEPRTVWDGMPRAASLDDVPQAIQPALARIRRERGGNVVLQVTDDLTARCVLRARIKAAA